MNRFSRKSFISRSSGAARSASLVLCLVGAASSVNAQTPAVDPVVPSVSFPPASGSAPAANPPPTPKPKGIQQIKTTAPIKDFRLPAFDKDGKRTTFIRADEALIVSPTQIDAKNMHFTLFTKDGTGAFDTVLLAPSATLLTDKQFVSGQESVRLLRADVEVTGEQWSFDKPGQRVIINKNAKVIFQEELKAIIK